MYCQYENGWEKLDFDPCSAEDLDGSDPIHVCDTELKIAFI